MSGPSATIDSAARDALVERLFTATVDTLELFSVFLGVRLGLYASLAGGDGLTPGELAAQAGIAERYAREWLEQQAVAGFLAVDDAGADAAERRFRLPPEHEPVLASPTDPAYLAPFSLMVAGIGRVLPTVADAYRTGHGVPYARYGRDFREGQGAINRPTFEHELPTHWLGALPDVAERLRSPDGARVAEVGSGEGWASIALARTYPAVRVDGIDADAASVADARRAAAEAGVADRVRFEERDASELGGKGVYDLVLVLEALHDLAHPVEALAVARAALVPGGCVLVVDERVADSFTAPGDELERMMYGWSIVHCLPTQLAEEGSAALGTVMRAHDVEKLARAAGFRQTTVLPVENDLFRLYRLDV